MINKMNYMANMRRFLILKLFLALFLSLNSIMAAEKYEKALLAGGCFWCVESDLEKVDGVIEAISGYTGGSKADATYKLVSAGATKHTEAVLIKFDPKKLSYSDLLEYFWRNIDPTDLNGQFVDRGSQYRPEIFYFNDQQLKEATESRNKLVSSKTFSKPIIVPITKAGKFYEAEDYHQDYYKKNPIRYGFYRKSSGRDKFTKKIWGKNQKYNHVKNSKKNLKERLTKLQYYVTQEDGTEPPFRNKYHDNKKPGIYVDIVSGEPLFSSTHKYDSKTGWPSFYQPLEKENIIEKVDTKLYMKRVEVRSKKGDSHLGHVFKDGPAPTGLRYCINSASLDFIPVDKLKERGLEKYLPLFKGKKK